MSLPVSASAFRSTTPVCTRSRDDRPAAAHSRTPRAAGLAVAPAFCGGAREPESGEAAPRSCGSRSGRGPAARARSGAHPPPRMESRPRRCPDPGPSPGVWRPRSGAGVPWFGGRGGGPSPRSAGRAGPRTAPANGERHPERTCVAQRHRQQHECPRHSTAPSCRAGNGRVPSEAPESPRPPPSLPYVQAAPSSERESIIGRRNQQAEPDRLGSRLGGSPQKRRQPGRMRPVTPRRRRTGKRPPPGRPPKRRSFGASRPRRLPSRRTRWDPGFVGKIAGRPSHRRAAAGLPMASLARLLSRRILR